MLTDKLSYSYIYIYIYIFYTYISATVPLGTTVVCSKALYIPQLLLNWYVLRGWDPWFLRIYGRLAWQYWASNFGISFGMLFSNMFWDYCWFLAHFWITFLMMFHLLALLFRAWFLYRFFIEVLMDFGFIFDVFKIPLPFAHATF